MASKYQEMTSEKVRTEYKANFFYHGLLNCFLVGHLGNFRRGKERKRGERKRGEKKGEKGKNENGKEKKTENKVWWTKK